MQHEKISRDCRNREAAFTLLELLVAMVITGLVMTSAVLHFSENVKTSRDHQIRLETFVEAQAIVQTLTNDIRMIGNGVPFDQPNFQIGESTLSDPTVTEPILVSSTTDSVLVFRLNENGEVYMLTSDFNPAVDLTVSLTSAEELAAGDPIYISNSVVAGDDGFYGVIESVSGNTATIAAGYVATPGATFATGSSFEEVPLITYISDGVTQTITRDTGFGPVEVGLNSTLTFDYLDYLGNSMVLPLTTADLIGALRSINISVTKTSNRAMLDGNYHTVTVSQTVAIRNLNIFF